MKVGYKKLLEDANKEITTISALKLALERRHNNKEGVSRILERVDEAKLMTYLEDDKISQEMYLEKLNGVLSTVTVPPCASTQARPAAPFHSAVCSLAVSCVVFIERSSPGADAPTRYPKFRHWCDTHPAHVLLS